MVEYKAELTYLWINSKSFNALAWLNVLDSKVVKRGENPGDCFEHWISQYVIPVTIDQRYCKKELDYLANIIFNN